MDDQVLKPGRYLIQDSSRSFLTTDEASHAGNATRAPVVTLPPGVLPKSSVISTWKIEAGASSGQYLITKHGSGPVLEFRGFVLVYTGPEDVEPKPYWVIEPQNRVGEPLCWSIRTPYENYCWSTKDDKGHKDILLESFDGRPSASGRFYLTPLELSSTSG